MKDFIKKSRFYNRAINNPTQNRYFRFIKGFSTPLESQFTRSQAEFDKPWDTKLKSIYWNEQEDTNGLL
jgi:hypothetical protein